MAEEIMRIEIAKLEMQLGDVLIVTVPSRTEDVEIERLKTGLRRILDHDRFMIARDVQFEVVHRVQYDG